MGTRGTGIALAVACAAVGSWVAAAEAGTESFPSTGNKRTGSCFFFGGAGNPFSGWAPYGGYIYKNLPAFDLDPGDTLAFDNYGVSNEDIRVTLALAATRRNGSIEPSERFKTVVQSTASPSSPRGNETIGDFDLRFRVTSRFSFNGGGLVIRVSNPAGTYASDRSCVGAVAGGNRGANRFFLNRFYADPDGAFPWRNKGNVQIAAFQIATNRLKTDRTRPSLGGLTLSSRATKLQFRLSEVSKVSFTVQRKAGGRWVKARSFTRPGKIGKNNLNFRGGIAGKSPKAVNYRLTVQATDPSKNKSVLQRKSFRLVE